MANNLLDAVAEQGRFGDTELVHVQPWEKQLLTDLGGANTVNPNTGLREYFDWGRRDEGGDTGGWNTWRPAQGSWGIFGETDARKRARHKREKASRVKKKFKAGIGDFKEENFATLSEGTRTAKLQELFGDDFDTADIDQYFDVYDRGQEYDVRETGAEEIGAVGERAQSGLLELTTGVEQMKARQGFAQSGNPMIDRQRKDIFSDIKTETGETWGGLLDTVGDLQDAYNESFITSAFDLRGAYTDTA